MGAEDFPLRALALLAGRARFVMLVTFSLTMVAPPIRLKVNWPTEPDVLVAIPCRYAIVVGVSREPRFSFLWGDPQRRRVKIEDPPDPPKGGDVLGGRGFVLDVSIGDWKEPFIRMPSLFELLPLTCFP